MRLTLVAEASATARVLLAGALLASAAFGVQTAATELPRFAGPKVRVGSEPRRLLVADLDGDGLDDVLATGRADTGLLSVRRALGEGLLDDTLDVTLNGIPWGVGVGDLDLDGALDAVVTLSSEDGFAVLYGDGAGGFDTAVFVPSLDEPREIVLADVDADGALDAVVCGAVDDLVAVHPGTGAAPILSVAPAAEPLAVADFDGDGDLDAAVGRVLTDTVMILEGDGTGGFVPVQSLAITGQPGRIVARDLDGDGDLDLAASGRAANIFIAGEPANTFTNLGAGTFGAATPWANLSDLCGIGLVADQLDGDGIPDLAYADWLECGLAFSNGPIQVLPGLGGLTYREGDRWNTGVRAMDLAAGDIDGDGARDLVSLSLYGPYGFVGPFAGGGPSDLSVFLGNGDATFHHTTLVPQAGFGLTFQRGHLLDVDDDGREDFVGIASDALGLALGQGDATMNAVVMWPSSFSLVDLALGDLDADGDEDVVVGHDDGKLITWMDIGVTLAPGPETPTSATPQALDLADLDGDPFADAVVGAADALLVLPGLGDGTLGPESVVALEGDHHAAVRGADLDGDGLTDVVTLGGAPDRLNTLLGDGALGFGPPSWTDSATPLPVGVELGDLDGDGVLDAVTVGAIDVRTWIGDGTGGFAAAGSATAAVARGVDLADVDVDGHLDVLVGNDDSGDVAVYRGQGDGALEHPVFLPVAGVVLVVRGSQLDADRPLEILATTLGRLHLLEERVTPWRDLGVPLPGSNGAPRLLGDGFPAAGETVTLQLSSARAATAATLVVGFVELGVPLKGGLLWPSPDLLTGGLVTGVEGTADLTASWPAGIPPGTSIVLQAWLPDAAGPAGFAASNGVEVVVP